MLQVLLVLAWILQIIIMGVFFNHMLQPRLPRYWNLLLICLGLAVVSVISGSMRPQYVIRLIVVDSLILVLVLLLYRDPPGYRCFIFILACGLTVALDQAILALLMLLFHNTEQGVMQSMAQKVMGTYLSMFVVTMLLMWIGFSKSRKGFSFRRETVYKFFLYPVSQMLLILSAFPAVPQRPNAFPAIFFSFCTLFCIVVDFFMLQAMVEAEKKAELEKELQTLEYQKAAELSEYQALREKDLAVSKLAHDYKNQLAVALLLLQEGDCAQAERLLSKTSDTLRVQEPPFFCHNRIVNAVMVNKTELCRQEDITLHWEIVLPEELSIAENALCSVFANLMDNAIKAVRPLSGDRKITIKAKLDGTFLMVKTENRYAENQYQKGRGLGQKILKEIAQEYNGTFETMLQGEVYLCLMALENQAPT